MPALYTTKNVALRMAPGLLWVWLLLLGAGCAPAVVTSTNCDVSADCSLGQSCVDGLCTDNGAVPCVDDSVCLNGQSCVNGFCTLTSMVDAGEDSDAAQDEDAAVVTTGGGIIQIDNELPIDFGSPLFGAEVERVVTVRNVGEGNLHIYRVDLAAGTSAEFSLSPQGTDADMVLQPDWTLDVRVTYVLADGEADVGEVLIISDAADCALTCSNPQSLKVPLYSEFKGARNLAVTPASHDFGFVSQGGSSLYTPFALSNDGTLTKVLTVSALRIEGQDASAFSLLQDSNDQPPYYLTPAAEHLVRVRYAPQNTAFHAAELVLSSNSDDPTRQELHVPLAGRSVPAAELTVTSPLDFGEVEIGQQVDRSTTIYNGGGMAATLIDPVSFATGTQGFSMIAPVLPVTIAPGAQASVTLRFAPNTVGAATDTVSFSHDAENSPLQLLLTGSGKEPPQGYSSIDVVQTFSATSVDTSACGFRTNYQNVDLKMTVGGLVCDKNTGGCTGDVCPCNLGQYGSATWSCHNCGAVSGSSETIGNFGSGVDGNFDLSTYYDDDCAAAYYEDAVTLQPICSFAGVREACFPIEYLPDWYVDGHISETQCMYGVAVIAGQCMAHAATKVRTVINLSSGTGPDQSLHFCTSLSSTGATQNVARIVRQEGLFNVTGPLGSTQQIAASAACQ